MRYGSASPLYCLRIFALVFVPGGSNLSAQDPKSVLESCIRKTLPAIDATLPIEHVRERGSIPHGLFPKLVWLDILIG